MKTILTAALLTAFAFAMSALALLPCATARAADPAVDKILQCMRGNIPPTVRIQTVEITARDRAGGERTLRGRLYATREGQLARVMLQIEAPSDLAGAAYLVRETKAGSDEIYLYLPATRKVRRITGPSQDGKLWGTDLSFNDVKQLQNAYTGASPKLEAPANLDGRPMNVQTMTPRPGDTVDMGLTRAWIDQKTCVPLKADFYEGQKARKQLIGSASALQKSGDYWYLSEVEMRDLVENTKTTLRVLGVTAGHELPGTYFNPQLFYLAN